MPLRPLTTPLVRCLARSRPVQPQSQRFSTAVPRWLESTSQSTVQSTPQPPQYSPIESTLASKPVSQTQVRLAYHVSRTPTNNLPVYLDIKAGKTLKQTRIRKIAGDVQVLRSDLVRSLKLDPEREKCEVNSVTGHIIIKGWHKPRVEKFLAEKGF